MARLFEFYPGRYSWNLDKCEETLLILAFLDIAHCVPPGQFWRGDFERIFFDEGKAVGEHFLASINDHRKRKGFEPITFIETDISSYARTPDKELRKQSRQQMRESILTMSADSRRKLRKQVEEEVSNLPLPHQTYEEWKAQQDKNDKENQASRNEVRGRVLAANPSGFNTLTIPVKQISEKEEVPITNNELGSGTEQIMGRRNFTEEQKRAIVAEAEDELLTIVAKRHDIDLSLISKWRRLYGGTVNTRRSWTETEKRQILAETYQDGETFTSVARRHGLDRHQLKHWADNYDEYGTCAQETIGRPPLATDDQKRAIVAEALDPSVTQSDVAKKYGLNRGTVYSWVKEFRDEIEPTIAQPIQEKVTQEVVAQEQVSPMPETVPVRFEPVAPPVAPDKLTKLVSMLQIATSPELKSQIITRISPEDAITIADTCSDAAVRDMLISRALEAF